MKYFCANLLILAIFSVSHNKDGIIVFIKIGKKTGNSNRAIHDK